MPSDDLKIPGRQHSGDGSLPVKRKRGRPPVLASDPLTPQEEEFILRIWNGEPKGKVAKELWPNVANPSDKGAKLINHDKRAKAYIKGLTEHSERRVRQLLESMDSGFEQRLAWIVEVAKLRGKNPTASLGACKHLDKLEGRSDEDYRRAGSLTVNYYAQAILQSGGRKADSLALPDVCARVLEDSAEAGGEADPLPAESDADGPGGPED
jgi:hypothetical protein